MTAAERRELGALKSLLVEMSEVLHDHMRLDLSPDAAMPRMKALRRRIRRVLK